MPHNFGGGFYTTTPTTDVKPSNVTDTKGKQPNRHGGEYTTNVATEANDREKQ